MKMILLIEDNDDIRNNTAEILELSNYRVVTAENGKRGVELAIQHKPDLIICDIMMPVLDGYGVLHAVHKNEAIKNTPFIFLTAKTERSDFRKGMELGADDYITKPFNGTELLNAVDSRLKKMEFLKMEISKGWEGLQQVVEMAGNGFTLESFIEEQNNNTYKKKQAVYIEGNHPQVLFYVVTGKVKTFKRNDDGKELVTALYSPGEFIGYVSLLEKSVYRDSAEALEESELAMIPVGEFEKIINSNWEVAKLFIRLLASNVAEKENQLLGLAYNSLRKKVADALLMLQKKYQTDDAVDFVIDITRENLATIAGTATESLIRTLSDFKAEKIINIKDGNISIINRKKLENLVN